MRVLFVFYAIIFAVGCIVSEGTKEIDLIVDLVKKYDKPTALTAFICWKTKLMIDLTNRLSNLKNPKTVRFENGVTKFLKIAPKDVIIIVDLNCPQLRNIFEQASNMNMFRSPHRWLIFERSTTKNVVPALLNNQNIVIDSEVIIARENGEGNFEMHLIYKVFSKGQWLTEFFGFWTKDVGIQISESMQVSTTLRRKNLRKLRISIAFNINDKEKGMDLEQNDAKIMNSHISITRWGYYQILALYEFLNATRVNIFTDNWGYFVNGTWNGIIGNMARGEVELAGTGIFMTKQRTEFASYLTDPAQTSVKFVFREPPLSYQNNLFLLPFSRAVWFALTGFVVIMMLVIYINAQWERVKLQILSQGDTVEHKLNVSDVALIVVGAISQQGSFVELKGSIGRLVMFTLFLVFLFLFTAYSASIVALLQSNSKQINTLSDLLNSKLELGVENQVYNKHYFTTATDPVRKAIYETKVAPRGSRPKFLTMEEGVKKLQKDPFAFNMDVGIGYRFVEKYFHEHEKCGLKEIAYVPPTKPWLTCRKGSLYTEIFKIGLYRLREHGMADRANSIVYSKKPVCTVSGGSFDSVSIMDAYPPFLLLLYGMLFACGLLVVEILVHSREIKNKANSEVKNTLII